MIRAREDPILNTSGRIGGWLILLSFTLFLPQGVRAQAPANVEVENEFTFASKLVERGFPDWAHKVLDALQLSQPTQAGRIQVLRAEALLGQRKLADVETMLKGMQPDDPKAHAIRLATANYYYSTGDVGKARELYNQFFASFKTVPTDADLLRSYLDSAYRFGKMLESAGDLPGTATAYQRVIDAKPERDVLRRVMSDLSQVLLRQAAADAAKKEELLKRAQKLCEDIQWGGTDIWFGQSIVTMANIAVLRGDRARAQKLLKDYDEILKEIDKALAERDALGESPVAAVRFMRGELAQQDADAMKADKSKTNEVVKLYGQALSEFYNVFVKYGESDQGPAAGVRVAQIKQILEQDFGRKVNVDLGDRADEAAATQMRLGDNLFRNKQFAEAAVQYQRAVNMFPQAAPSIRGLAQLTMSYGEQKDRLSTEALIGYVGERFAGNTNAANTLLSVGKFFRDRNETNLYFLAYETYLAAHPKHALAGTVLFTLFADSRKAGREAEGLAYLDRLVKDYKQGTYYPRALNLLALSRYSSSNYLGAIETFQVLLADTPPSPEKATAQFSLADCYVKLERWTEAVAELEKLIGWLTPKDNPYAVTPDQVARNLGLLEKATFQRANCFMRVKEPADQLAAFREQALKAYGEFTTAFPTSSLASRALNGVGQVQLELGRPDDAVKTFEELAKRYPMSDEGKDALYTMARAALEIGKVEIAKDAFTKMVGQPDRYKPDAFVRLGQLFLDKQAWAEGSEAFKYVQGKTTERLLLERALYGIGKANYELKRYEEAVKGMETLMKTYEKTGLFYDAKFVLGESYAALGRTDDAIAAIADVLRKADDATLRLRADYRLGEIYEATDKAKAFASYQRIILLTDPNKLDLRPYLEKACLRSLPLGMELKKYKDVIETSDQFMKLFPQNARIEEVRSVRSQANLKASEG